MAGRLIFAFPALGKTTFKKNNPRAVDMELSDIKYCNKGYEHLTHEERKMLPRPLKDKNFKSIFSKVSGYLSEERDVLVVLNYLPHFLLKYPLLVWSAKIYVPHFIIKEEFMSRYRSRGNNQYFIRTMNKIYYPVTFVFFMLSFIFKQVVITKSGEYLSDYIS